MPRLGLSLVGLGLTKTWSWALVDSLGWAGLGSGLSLGFRVRTGKVMLIGCKESASEPE